MIVIALGVWVMPTVAQEATVLFLLLVGLVSVPLALRRRTDVDRRPWWLLFAGLPLNLMAIIVRGVHGAAVGEDFPFPSLADGFALAAMASMMTGLYLIARSRRAFGGAGDTLDVLMLALSIAGPFWILVLDAYFRDSTFSLMHRSMTAFYAVLEVGLIAVTLRLLVGPGRRSATFVLLGVVGIVTAALDAVFILDTIGLPGAGLALPIASVVAVSSQILPRQPDLADISARPPATDPRLTATRVATMALAMLTIPALLLLQSVGRGTLADPTLVLVFVASLSALVLWRILNLLRGRDRIADLDVIIRDAGQESLVVETLDELAALAGETLRRLDPSLRSAVVLRNAAGDAVLVTCHDGRTTTTASVDWQRTDDDARLAEILGPDDAGLSSHIALGTANGSLVVLPRTRLENAQQLALETFATQLAMAVRGIESRELSFQQRAERRLFALSEQSSDVVAVLDDDRSITYISPNVDQIMGRASASVVGNHPIAVVHPDDASAIGDLLDAPTRADESATAIEGRMRTGSGEYRWYSLTARDFASDPEVAGLVLTARDITEERAAKLGLLRSEQWFRGLVQNSSDVIAVLDEAGVFTYASPAVTQLTGSSPSDLQGRTFTELLPADDTDSLERVHRAIRSKPPGVRNLELMIERPDHSRRMAEVTITDLREDPSVQGLVLNIRDITDRKRLEEDLRHQVLHDDLTGLGSRVQFSNQLQAALAAPRRDGAMVAALFIDIDDFKTINDSLGHAAGDQVLVDISGRLRSRLRLHDNAARFGGDEFAVLLTDVYGETDVTLVADRIIEELSRPVMLMGTEVRLSVSVGIALDEDATATPEDLLRAADVAMYEAKDQGKGRWAMFESSMADQTLERFEINNSLAHAIDNDELMVHYQPIVDLGSGRTVGVEALVRWDHPVRGMISPGQFIPIAERNGMIAPIGHWVLTEAAHQVAAWRRDGHDLYASVNVSAVQLQRDGIVDEILDVVDEATIDRHAIVLELTESALISDFELVNLRIDALRDAGLRVAIDDFGTGYATLTYADQFAADILKIDQSFVARLEDSDDSAIVTTVLNIAAAMGAETIAEGIEVPDQHRRLVSLGCALGQGYYFKRPAPADVIGESLAREREGEALAGHGH
ncbi:MAG: EAL domain-containing protein [Actinomycetota bacterium]